MKIHIDKISSSTKNFHLKHEVEISRKIICKEGYVLAVKVLENKKIYNQLELTTGRLSTIHADDILVVTLGNRRALKGFVGEVPEKLKVGDIIHVLNLGGVAGMCTSASLKQVGHPLRVEVLGAVIDKKKKQLNIQEHRLFSPAKKIKTCPPLIIISGSCMEVGKTSVASEIIKAGSREGQRICAAKVAGVAALKDTMRMQDYGAIKAVSIIDAGHSSTANETASSISIAKGAINFLSKEKPDYIVMELGDGIFGEYGVLEILKDPEFQQYITAHIGCASDPMSATKLYEVCQEIGTPLHIISGAATDNSVGIKFIKKNLKVKAFNCLSQGPKIFAALKKYILNP